MTRHPWLAIFPGLMIFITVISINYIGDAFRDAIDPYKVI
jgi:peptide/nickel transport system permease protein